MHKSCSILRKEGLTLLKNTAAELNWNIRFWIPSLVLFSSIYFLPPVLLQLFTPASTKLNEITGVVLIHNILSFGILIGGCLWVGSYLKGALTEKIEIQIVSSLRSKVLNSVLNSKIEEHHTDWMTNLTSHLASCERYLSKTVPKQIHNLTILIGSALLLLMSCGWLALTLIFGAIGLCWLIQLTQRKRTQPLNKIDDVSFSLNESFEGLRTIRSFGGESFIQKRFEKHFQSLREPGVKTHREMPELWVAAQIAITFALTLFAYQLTGDSLLVHDALGYPFYIYLFLNSLLSLFASIYKTNTFFVEDGNLETVMNHDTRSVSESNSILGSVGVAAISGKNIEPQPTDTTPINFKISRGKILVLLGPCNSSLIEVMAGLRDHYQGELFLSTKHSGAENVPSIPKSICAFVERPAFIFTGSIRDNIKLGQPRLFDVEIMSVIKALGLAEIVGEHGGLDALLKDTDQNWSEGQLYRLSLCRALVSRKPFLILEAPFAGLDQESIEKIVYVIDLARKAGSGIVVSTDILPDNFQADEVITVKATA